MITSCSHTACFSDVMSFGSVTPDIRCASVRHCFALSFACSVNLFASLNWALIKEQLKTWQLYLMYTSTCASSRHCLRSAKRFCIPSFSIMTVWCFSSEMVWSFCWSTKPLKWLAIFFIDWTRSCWTYPGAMNHTRHKHIHITQSTQIIDIYFTLIIASLHNSSSASMSIQVFSNSFSLQDN